MFDENADYILTFAQECSLQLRQQIEGAGGEMLSPDSAMLGFRNFVGTSFVAGVNVQVTSTKISAEGVSRLLEQISELGSALVFAHGSPTRFSAEGYRTETSPVPYHQLQFLRKSMLESAPGWRLQDWLSVIERGPTRRFEQERPVVPIDRVRRMDQRAMLSIFHRLDRISPVPAGSMLESSRLADALKFGEPPALHFPNRVAAPRGRLSFDTPENRFVRHVLETCLALIYRFVDHPKLHKRLRADCRTMLAMLEQVATQPFIFEATRLTGFSAPSQALTKGEGYREVFGFWMRLQEHVSMPSDPAITQRLLEGRDIALLYEYWVFLKVLESVVSITGASPSAPPHIVRDDFGESLAVDVPLNVASHITVRFNPTFTRTRGTAYSTPLRPDVILTVGESKYAFDAKYRLDRLNSDENEADSGATYKRADLYKMHAYRDAIHSLKAAFVVYPGSEFIFFDRARGSIREDSDVRKADGVGAIPLRPSDENPVDSLRRVVTCLLALP
ncbi:MAG: DUF2357 domain-containing protein [Rhodanobacter sp.]